MAESKTTSKAKRTNSTKKTAEKTVAKTSVNEAAVKKVTKTSAIKKPAVKKVVKTAAKTTVKAAVKTTPETTPKTTPETKVKDTPKTEVKDTPQAETKETQKEIPATNLPEIDLQEMFDAGCHFGHKVSKWHPKMEPYIYGSEGGVHIFDLEKTSEQLRLACQRFYDLAKDGKTLLMIGTKRSARDIIREAATEIGCFYIVSRWMGGLLTNFKQLQKSIQRMGDIETGLQSGKFDKYTKYERLQLDKEKTRLERFFVGLTSLKGKPDCVFVVDSEKEDIAVKESLSEGVELIAIADSNADPRQIDIVIPANDDASKSVKYIVNCLKTAYNAGKTARQ